MMAFSLYFMHYYVYNFHYFLGDTEVNYIDNTILPISVPEQKMHFFQDLYDPLSRKQ